MRNLPDVVHQGEQLPLRIDLFLTAQAEAFHVLLHSTESRIPPSDSVMRENAADSVQGGGAVVGEGLPGDGGAALGGA